MDLETNDGFKRGHGWGILTRIGFGIRGVRRFRVGFGARGSGVRVQRCFGFTAAAHAVGAAERSRHRTSRMRHWTLRILVAMCCLVVLGAIAGTTYQWPATRKDLASTPPPGHPVDPANPEPRTPNPDSRQRQNTTTLLNASTTLASNCAPAHRDSSRIASSWLIASRIYIELDDIAAARNALTQAKSLNPRSTGFADLARRGG